MTACKFSWSKLCIKNHSFNVYFAVEAATKIQAAFRGHKVRANMKKGDANNDNAEREPTKEELEAEFDLNDQGKFQSYFSLFSLFIIF